MATPPPPLRLLASVPFVRPAHCTAAAEAEGLLRISTSLAQVTTLTPRAEGRAALFSWHTAQAATEGGAMLIGLETATALRDAYDEMYHASPQGSFIRAITYEEPLVFAVTQFSDDRALPFQVHILEFMHCTDTRGARGQLIALAHANAHSGIADRVGARFFIREVDLVARNLSRLCQGLPGDCCPVFRPHDPYSTSAVHFLPSRLFVPPPSALAAGGALAGSIELLLSAYALGNVRLSPLSYILAFWERHALTTTASMQSLLQTAQTGEDTAAGMQAVQAALGPLPPAPAHIFSGASPLDLDPFAADALAAAGGVTFSSELDANTPALAAFNDLIMTHGPGGEALFTAPSVSTALFLGMHAGDGSTDQNALVLKYGTAMMEAQAHLLAALMVGGPEPCRPVFSTARAANGANPQVVRTMRPRSLVYTLRSRYPDQVVAQHTGELLVFGDHHYGFGLAYATKCLAFLQQLPPRLAPAACLAGYFMTDGMLRVSPAPGEGLALGDEDGAEIVYMNFSTRNPAECGMQVVLLQQLGITVQVPQPPGQLDIIVGGRYLLSRLLIELEAAYRHLASRVAPERAAAAAAAATAAPGQAPYRFSHDAWIAGGLGIDFAPTAMLAVKTDPLVNGMPLPHFAAGMMPRKAGALHKLSLAGAVTLAPEDAPEVRFVRFANNSMYQDLIRRASGHATQTDPPMLRLNAGQPPELAVVLARVPAASVLRHRRERARVARRARARLDLAARNAAALLPAHAASPSAINARQLLLQGAATALQLTSLAQLPPVPVPPPPPTLLPLVMQTDAGVALGGGAGVGQRLTDYLCFRAADRLVPPLVRPGRGGHFLQHAIDSLRAALVPRGAVFGGAGAPGAGTGGGMLSGGFVPLRLLLGALSSHLPRYLSRPTCFGPWNFASFDADARWVARWMVASGLAAAEAVAALGPDPELSLRSGVGAPEAMRKLIYGLAAASIAAQQGQPQPQPTYPVALPATLPDRVLGGTSTAASNAPPLTLQWSPPRVVVMVGRRPGARGAGELAIDAGQMLGGTAGQRGLVAQRLSTLEPPFWRPAVPAAVAELTPQDFFGMLLDAADVVWVLPLDTQQLSATGLGSELTSLEGNNARTLIIAIFPQLGTDEADRATSRAHARRVLYPGAPPAAAAAAAAAAAGPVAAPPTYDPLTSPIIDDSSPAMLVSLVANTSPSNRAGGAFVYPDLNVGGVQRVSLFHAGPYPSPFPNALAVQQAAAAAGIPLFPEAVLSRPMRSAVQQAEVWRKASIVNEPFYLMATETRAVVALVRVERGAGVLPRKNQTGPTRLYIKIQYVVPGLGALAGSLGPCLRAGRSTWVDPMSPMLQPGRPSQVRADLAAYSAQVPRPTPTARWAAARQAVGAN